MAAFKDIDPIDLDFQALHDHHKALEQEFKELDLSTDDSPDEIRQKIRMFAVNNLENALKKIAELVDGGDKHAIQLSAAKTLIAIAQGTSPKDENDALSGFLKSIATDAEKAAS